MGVANPKELGSNHLSVPMGGKGDSSCLQGSGGRVELGRLYLLEVEETFLDAGGCKSRQLALQSNCEFLC